MIAIIDYKCGNIASVTNSLERLKAKYLVTADPTKILAADRVIFPGVGSAGYAMEQVCELPIAQIRQPFLGICLGMQLLTEYSAEDDTNCLGIIPGKVQKFPADLPIPQIGWNQVSAQQSPLFKEIPDNSYFYFVNSYYYNGPATIATSRYGLEFAGAIQQDNFYATQFHPEKSGAIGQKLLSNFLEL